jgi:hypothetical protein
MMLLSGSVVAVLLGIVQCVTQSGCTVRNCTMCAVAEVPEDDDDDAGDASVSKES